MERRGAQSVEMIMWLAMRSALGADVRRVHRHHYAPMLTAYGLLVLETPSLENRNGYSSGRSFSRSLRDGRQMWIDGELVHDVTRDRRFALDHHGDPSELPSPEGDSF